MLVSLMWLVSEGASWHGWRQGPAPLSQQGCVILSAVVCQFQLKAFGFGFCFVLILFGFFVCVFFFFLAAGLYKFSISNLQIIVLKEISPCLVSLPGAREGGMHRTVSLSLGFAWAEPGVGEKGVLVFWFFSRAAGEINVRGSWFHFCLNTWERNVYLSYLEADQY